MTSPLDLMVEMLQQEGTLYLYPLGKLDEPSIIRQDAQAGGFCYDKRHFIEPLLAILVAVAEHGGLHRIFTYRSEPM